MQCRFDPRHHSRGDVVDASGLLYFVDDFTKHAERIVPLPEEAPVERRQPLPPLEHRNQAQCTDSSIDPAAGT